MGRLTARVALALALAGGAGCLLFDKQKKAARAPVDPPTYSQYHLDGWQWAEVKRVLVLPFLNETQYTRAGDEVRVAFAAELERAGVFEVVAAPPDERAVQAIQIHRGGRFDEAAMLDLARSTKADVIVHGIITHYSPYPRPKIGLIIQVVGPQQAKVVASVAGFWDTTDCAVAERCRTYYRQRAKPRLPFVRNNKVVESDDELAGQLALESPALFQRWVSFEILTALFSEPPPVASGVNSPTPASAGPGTGTRTPPDPAAPVPTDGKVK